MKKTIYILLLLMIGLIPMVTISCKSNEVERTEADTITDLSGRWNDTDSRLVAEEMIATMLEGAWIHEHTSRADGKKPVVIAGYIKNRSSEHIQVSGIVADIEKALINSGRVSVVADSTQRQQVRDEREQQQEEASFETIKRLGEETGADYMLIGNIISQSDSAGKTTAVTYQVSLELVEIETTQKVWVGDKKIKKIIQR